MVVILRDHDAGGAAADIADVRSEGDGGVAVHVVFAVRCEGAVDGLVSVTVSCFQGSGGGPVRVDVVVHCHSAVHSSVHSAVDVLVVLVQNGGCGAVPVAVDCGPNGGGGPVLGSATVDVVVAGGVHVDGGSGAARRVAVISFYLPSSGVVRFSFVSWCVLIFGRRLYETPKIRTFNLTGITIL